MDINNDSLASILAISSGFLFALSIQIQNLGLQDIDSRTGAVISILATTVVYWMAAPFLIESSYWLESGTVWFALVGLFRPALSANFAMTSIRYMGPTLTSAIASTNPIFGAFFAIFVLGEILTFPIAIGTVVVILGIVIGSMKTRKFDRGWPIWAISFPLGAAFFRAAGHPLTIIGYETVSSPFFAGLVSYSISLIVSLTAYKTEGRKIPKLSRSYGWFIISGLINGFSLYLLNYALGVGQLLSVSPIVACSPVFTMILGLLIFKKEVFNLRIVLSLGFVVVGVILVILY